MPDYLLLIEPDPTLEEGVRKRGLRVLANKLKELREELGIEEVVNAGNYLECISVDPVEVAMALSRFPGVFRVGVCKKGRLDEAFELVEEVAKKLLRKGMSFNLSINELENTGMKVTDVYYKMMESLLEAVDSRPDDIRPDLLIRVSVSKRGVYVEHYGLIGPSGIPPGTFGKAVILFSGGIGSYVASLRACRAGLLPILVFINPEGGPADYVRRAFYKAWTLLRGLPLKSLNLYVVGVKDGTVKNMGIHGLLKEVSLTIAKKERANFVVSGLTSYERMYEAFKEYLPLYQKGIFLLCPNVGYTEGELEGLLSHEEDRHKLKWTDWRLHGNAKTLKDEERRIFEYVMKVRVERGPVGWHKALDGFLRRLNRGKSFLLRS